jgi:signal transduction histidine kinase
MGKTVFSKLMIIFIVIILISTVVSAVLISQSYSDEYTKRAQEDMIDVAKDVSAVAAYNYYNIISLGDFVRLVSQQAANNDDVIWVVNMDGEVRLSVGPAGETNITKDDILKYYANMLDEVQKGNIAKLTSESDNAFDTPVLTVGMPVIVYGDTIGAVLVHKKLSDLNGAMVDMYSRIVFAALLSAIVAVVLIYFLAKNILKPLKKVTEATAQLARGNFDVRLDLNSEDEIGELSRTFNSVAKDLGKYENIRRSFVANVSHELRSPLTSMQGLVQGVLDGTIPEEQRDYYLNVVLDETRRLNYLINDLLDLSQIESGKLDFNIQKTDINELIRRCLITFESKIFAKNIEVVVDIKDEKQFVMADENRIKQVLMNLIDNAVKFTPNMGTIKIYTSESPASVFVNVNNSGGPIPEEDLPYVFERFYKADKSHTRTQEGTGIGLSIVKKVLDGHGQNIWVKSSEGEGTTFTFTLKKI